MGHGLLKNERSRKSCFTWAQILRHGLRITTGDNLPESDHVFAQGLWMVKLRFSPR